jgi:gas vesicle protein
MEAMPQTWNDDRMGELAAHVDAGFAQARVDLGSSREELRREIKELRDEVKAQGDELRAEIKAQGDELRAEIKAQGDDLRGEIKAQGDDLRGEIKAQGQELRSEINARFDIVDRRFDSLHAAIQASQRTMIQLCGGLCVALIAAVATLISTVL